MDFTHTEVGLEFPMHLVLEIPEENLEHLNIEIQQCLSSLGGPCPLISMNYLKYGYYSMCMTSDESRFDPFDLSHFTDLVEMGLLRMTDDKHPALQSVFRINSLSNTLIYDLYDGEVPWSRKDFENEILTIPEVFRTAGFPVDDPEIMSFALRVYQRVMGNDILVTEHEELEEAFVHQKLLS